MTISIGLYTFREIGCTKVLSADSNSHAILASLSMSATAIDPQHRPSAPSIESARWSGVGDWVESHNIVCLLVLFAIYLCAELGYSLRIPLWHDEIFTWHIAQAPSVGSLLHLANTIDLNPPLSYLLTRATFHLCGVGTLQTRLPEIAGFGLALVCVYVFVGRRAGNAYGLLAATILFCSKVSEPVIQGRPYGLMFGFGGLMLVAWQSSTIAQDRGSRAILSDLLLAFAASALLLTHVFGLFIWAAIVAAEATRSCETRQLAPSRLVALILPLTATLLYVPLFRLHAANSFPPAFQAHLSDIVRFYADRTSRELVSLCFTIILIVALAGRSWLRPAQRFVLTRPEWVAIFGILVTPAAIVAWFAHHHAAFFYRYGDIAALGLAILFSVLLCRLTANHSTTAVFAALIFLIVSSRWQHALIFAAQGQIFRHTEPAIIPFHSDQLTKRNLPLVVNSGLVFTEMNNHEGIPLLDGTYYLTGGPVAIHYTNATIFEGMAKEVEAFHFHGHAESYRAFIRQHPNFYLLAGDHDFPEDWLLRKLHDDGAQVRLAEHIENSYRDHELYEVTIPVAAN
jgi:hypothetical protein